MDQKGRFRMKSYWKAQSCWGYHRTGTGDTKWRQKATNPRKSFVFSLERKSDFLRSYRITKTI